MHWVLTNWVSLSLTTPLPGLQTYATVFGSLLEHQGSNCRITCLLGRQEQSPLTPDMEVQRKNTINIQLGEPLSFIGVIYRSRNDSCLPKACATIVTAHETWEPQCIRQPIGSSTGLRVLSRELSGPEPLSDSSAALCFSWRLSWRSDSSACLCDP